MPGEPDKQYRIRVKALDGNPRDQSAINRLKSNQLGMPHLDIVGAGGAEFIICASKDTHIEQVRGKLQGAGLEAIDGGDITITAAAPKSLPQQLQRHNGYQHRGGQQDRGGQHRGGAPHGRQASANNVDPLPGKPYEFVSLPNDLRTATPVWHDGTSSQDRLSGEIRFELEALTPLLVGWERGQVNNGESDWPVPANLANVGQLKDKKSVLCPLRAPWGKRPAVIPGDSLKGLLRHELGALLGAPMERVVERSYSYRPNALFTKDAEPKLLARIARVPNDGVEMKALDNTTQVRVPTKLELLPMDLRYDKAKWVNGKKEWTQNGNYYRFDDGHGATYHGGQGAGEKLNSKRNLHTRLNANPSHPTQTAMLSQGVQDGYLSTLRHLIDLDHGHFSERHPDVPKRQGKTESIDGEEARKRILEAAQDDVFQPGDLVWVEWDTEKNCIVSLGWHYYYRWAYIDSIRKDADAPRLERHGLFPLATEREKDGNAPKELSLVRRLLGYAFDKENPGVAGIGGENTDHSQLMGRVFINSGLEVVGENDTDEQRFLGPTFLKELGMPRPSAVEHYLKQNLDGQRRPQKRPSDNATLVTYGDAAGYDKPGELAGRKFYLDRPGAVAEDPSNTNRQNDRSTLALEASRPGRKFRFTVRFRDLDAAELAAILVALSPEQFKGVLGGTHAAGYCSKLGYARPLGWGSVRIEAKAFLLLDETGDAPALNREENLIDWVTKNHQKTITQADWLAIHRRNHPNAADYPRPQQADRNGERNIYTFHTTLRAEHSRARRYRNGGK